MRALVIYLNAFLLGSIVMGFEMLGSRYLYPYFGGGIGTWAALIAVVLAALMVGYFVGGALADRHPSARVIAAIVLAAGAYLAAVPTISDALLLSLMEGFGDGPLSVLTATSALLMVPVGLLGMYMPFSIRLLIRDPSVAGSLSGRLYAVSTFGNIFGILFVTFTLVPMIGTRAITYLCAVLAAACAVSLFSLRR